MSNGSEEERRRKIIIEGGTPGSPFAGDLCSEPPEPGQVVICVSFTVTPENEADAEKLMDAALTAGAEIVAAG